MTRRRNRRAEERLGRLPQHLPRKVRVRCGSCGQPFTDRPVDVRCRCGARSLTWVCSAEGCGWTTRQAVADHDGDCAKGTDA